MFEKESGLLSSIRNQNIKNIDSKVNREFLDLKLKMLSLKHF